MQQSTSGGSVYTKCEPVKKINFTDPAQRKKAVLWHVAGGWLSNLIFIIQGLVLVPLYIDYLGERLYGFWLATGGVLAMLSMIDVGASAVTQQRCAAAYGRKDMHGVLSYFMHGAAVTVAMLFLFGLLVVVVSWQIVSWVGVDSEFRQLIVQAFLWAGLAAGGRLTNDFMRYFASALQRNQFPVFAQTLGDLLGLVCIVVSLIVYGAGLWSLVFGALIRAAVPLIINLCHTVWMVVSIDAKVCWSKEVLRDYLTTTPAVLAAKAGGQFAGNLPVILIAKWLGPEASVIYTVTIRVVQMVRSFINHALAGLYAACAHYFNDAAVARERRRATVSALVRGYTVVCGVGVVLYAFFNHGFVRLWTSEAQFAGQMFTALASVATFLHVRNTLIVGMGVSVGAIRSVHIIRAAENVVVVVLTIVGVYFYGLAGAMLAVILAALAMQGVYFKLLKRQSEDMAIALKPLSWLWLPVAGVIASSWLVGPLFVRPDWLSFVVLCALTSAPFAIVVALSLPALRTRLMKLLMHVPGLRSLGRRYA